MIRIPFTAQQAIAYATLPRIIPRLKTIGFRFSFVAALMAMIYGMVRLLPPGHPYLNPANTGTYSVRQVFTEAARQLRFNRKHIDQIIIFFVLLAAFILLTLQFMMMFGYLFIGIAQASGIGFSSMFATPDPTNDIAFVLLDRVFGLPGMFNSCISTTATCDPTSSYLTPYEPPSFPEPHQVALQSLFGFFNVGIGMVGVGIIVYYLIVVVLESMHDGVPMGGRFASAYAPIRLCLAVLMLVPLPMKNGALGYNSAQYLVLYMANIGSSFGTNGWNVFNNTFSMGGVGLTAQPGYGPLNPGAPSSGSSGGGTTPMVTSPAGALIAMPVADKIDPLLQFMFIAQSCRAMYETSPAGDFFAVDAYGDTVEPRVRLPIEPYIVMPDGSSMRLQTSTTYANALTFVRNGDIRIRIGVQSPGVGIKPLCGELTLRVGDLQSPGAAYLLENHFGLVGNMWTNDAIKSFGDRMAAMFIPNAKPICGISVPFVSAWGEDPDTCGGGNASPWMPKVDYYNEVRNPYQALLESFIVTARDKQIQSITAQVDNKILNRGWAGAGIWYNRLAQMNGGLFDAAKSLPTITRMPEPMEAVMSERKAATQEITAKSRYTPAGMAGRMISTYNVDIASGLNQVYLYFQDGGIARADVTTKATNPIFDLMNRLFGTAPLFNMRDAQDINPLVQMTALGKSILDAAFYNILVGGGIEFAGGILQQLGGWQQIGGALNTLGNAWFSIASIGLGIGILLYYVIPFLPFIYFFFSVIKWVQSVFEAMIGMPMWALAHLRIDGDGIPTEAAEGGYFLLLEIALRPILTVIGMIASFMIFTAMIYGLNDIFNLLTVNLTGYNPPSSGSMVADLEIKRGTIDQFFYTVMYAVLVYIIAVGSFKLIDLIPLNIFRWIGSSAKNIIDEMGDPVPGMIRSTYIGAFGLPLAGQQGMLGQAIKGVHRAVEGTGRAVGETIASTTKGVGGP